jgi:hypothetical protein
VTLTITDQLISSGHAVRSQSGRSHALEVSPRSGQLLDRKTAIAVMMLADTASDSRRDVVHRLLPAIHNWADEHGFTSTRRGRTGIPTTRSDQRKPPMGCPSWTLPNGCRRSIGRPGGQ